MKVKQNLSDNNLDGIEAILEKLNSSDHNKAQHIFILKMGPI